MRFRHLSLAATALTLAGRLPAQASADSGAVAAVVERFHAALAAGDSAAALGLLGSDLLVLESGGIETLAEYRAHHLPADIAFAQAVPSTRRILSVTVRGDAAWLVAAITTNGTFRERPISSSGAELVVLSRESAGWRIRAIHWSSRARRATAPGLD